MTLQEKCRVLSETKLTLAQFEREHASLLAEHAALVVAVGAATDDVKKAAVAEVPTPCVKTYHGVEVTRVVSRLLDPERLAKVPGIENVPGIFKAAVDAKVVAAAVRAGVLRAEDVDACRTLPHADYAKVA